MENIVLTRHALPERIPKWGIKVLESHHSHDFTMEWRRHSFLKIVYALAGRGTFFVEDNQFDFHAKDILIVPKHCRNRIVDSPNVPSSLYILCLSPSLLGFDSSLEEKLQAGRVACSEYHADKVESLLRRLLFFQSNSGEMASLSMASVALNLLQVVIEGSGKAQEAEKHHASDIEMLQYLEYLDSYFYEAQDINMAAERLGISRRSFTKRFREATGVTWLEYVRGKAVDHAAHLLTNTTTSVTSIAFECGFSDLSTFYRQFKAKRGLSPSAWRKKYAS